MVYTVSTHNNIDSLWLKLVYLSNTFPSPVDIIIMIIVFSKAAILFDCIEIS